MSRPPDRVLRSAARGLRSSQDGLCSPETGFRSAATGLRSRVQVRAEPDGRGGIRLPVLRSAPPISLRPVGDVLYLVASAAGPLGGDQVEVEVEITAGAALTVATVAASLALPGRSGAASSLRVSASVGEGATLRWLPEPLVACGGCDHRVSAAVEVADGAGLEWREELILGRHGEAPGDCRTGLRIDVGGRPLLRQELRTGPAAPGWDGPAGLAGARAVGQLALVGPGLRHSGSRTPGPDAALLELDGPGVLVTALAADALALRRALADGRRSARPAEAGRHRASDADRGWTR